MILSNGSVTYGQQFVGSLVKDQIDQTSVVVGHSTFGVGQVRANDDKI